MASKPASAKGASAAHQPPKSAAVIKRELSANNYIALVVAGTLLVVLICGFVGRMLLVNAITNTQLLIKKGQASGDLDKKLDTIPELVDNYNALGDKKTLILHALPTTADFPALVSTIQTMSTTSGVKLRSIDPTITGVASTAAETPLAPNGAMVYQFSVSVGGGYPQIVQFFRSIEHSARPMKVVSTEFTGNNNQVEANATISTYFQPTADIGDKTETLK